MKWLKDNLGYIKWVLIAILFIAFFISVMLNNRGNARMILLEEKFSKLEALNVELKKKQKEYEELYKLTEKEREELQKEYDLLIKEKQRLEKENIALRKEISKIPSSILNTPADSSYFFLNTIAYPYPGVPKYPFNETQVKNMHINYVENIQYEMLIAVQDTQLLNYKGLEFVLGIFNNSYKETIDILEKKNNGLTQMYENEQQKSQLCEKELNKQNKKRNLWKATTGVVSAIAIVLLII